MRERPHGGAEERADLSGLGRLSERPPPPRRERAAPVIRAISLVLLAIAAAGLPWYFLTQAEKDPGRSVGPTPTTSTSPSTSPSASPSAGAARYQIVGVTECLRIREQPTTNAGVVDCLGPGVRVTSDGRSQTSEARLWRHVYDPFKKMWGWAADEFLKPVP